MSDDILMKYLNCLMGIIKWFVLQTILILLLPYFLGKHLCIEFFVFVLLYTTLYSIFAEFIPRKYRVNWVLLPYLLYAIIVITTSFWKETISIGCYLLLPIYGALCVIAYKYTQKLYRKRKLTTCIYVVAIICLMKAIGVSLATHHHGTIESEKKEILARRNYLLEKLITSPENVLNEMPAIIGTQFQGEWALYSCSMLSAALTNIAHLYPETKDENNQYIDKLITIVMSYEMRYYDNMRWKEDPLETLDGDKSHISYISHLAWMICNYKATGGDKKYDSLLSTLCQTMNRRILASKALNLPTYPNEAIYIPDMLVAIVALNQYANMNNGKYKSTVQRWIQKAKTTWSDEETALLASFLQEDGTQYEDAPIKGSYAALNCYYLTLIDEAFAQQQYTKLKSLFWKNSFISGLKEYHDRKCYIGMDIDAGPIIFELSPSGTAFAAGSATFFNDTKVRKQILKTAEIAGHTLPWNGNKHYLLADVALVGEAIMLAMRTNYKN
ncbi:MAG: hypothetical protein IKT76_01040 [Bacteroides sp.]|nr:hypothetical protein [Bacteroides sp.]